MKYVSIAMERPREVFITSTPTLKRKTAVGMVDAELDRTSGGSKDIKIRLDDIR